MSSSISLLIRTHRLVRSCALSSRATGKMLSQWFFGKFPAPWLLTLYLLGQTLLTTFIAWTPNWPQHSHGLTLGYKPHLTLLRISHADTKMLVHGDSHRTGVVSEQFLCVRNNAPTALPVSGVPSTTSDSFHNQQPWIRTWISNRSFLVGRLSGSLPISILLFFIAIPMARKVRYSPWTQNLRGCQKLINHDK